MTSYCPRPDWADVFTASEPPSTPAPAPASATSVSPDGGDSAKLLDAERDAAGIEPPAAPGPKPDTPSVEEIERFFVDGIEDLRIQLGAEKIVLLGHSLGGYIACAYAERHPDRVERLVLCGCAGVPDQPPDPENMAAPSWVRRLARWLWTKEISPFQLVQWGGKSLLGWYASANKQTKPKQKCTPKGEGKNKNTPPPTSGCADAHAYADVPALDVAFYPNTSTSTHCCAGQGT